MKQKEEIITKARLLDKERLAYGDEKQKIIQNVTMQTKKLEYNSSKRKTLEEILVKEQNLIDLKKAELA
jgi:hypothetical protein